MWQTYALGALIAGAFEQVVDKAAIVRDGRIDSLIATFYRSLFISVAFAVIGFTGILGELTLFFHWSLVLLAVLYVGGALGYTYLLRRVEVVSIGAVAYLASFLYLVIDMYILGIPITGLQVIGVVLLVFGGMAFALDGKTRHFNGEFTLGVICVAALVFVGTAGFEAYLFKYLHATYAVNGVSYLAAGSLPASVILLVLVLVRGRAHRLVTHPALVYMPYAAAGKAFDAVNSVLYASALTLASVSQVTAFESIAVLVLFIVAAVIQGEFHVRLKEKLDHARFLWKAGAVCLLVLGGFLVG